MLRHNAPVQLRAVGSPSAPQVDESIGIQALNRNAWSARQLQRMLARVDNGGCEEPGQPGSAGHDEACARGPVMRTGGNPTACPGLIAPHATKRLTRDCGAVVRELAVAEAVQGEIGPAHA